MVPGLEYHVGISNPLIPKCAFPRFETSLSSLRIVELTSSDKTIRQFVLVLVVHNCLLIDPKMLIASKVGSMLFFTNWSDQIQ